MENTLKESLSIVKYLDSQSVQIIKVPPNSKPHIVPFEWWTFEETPDNSIVILKRKIYKEN